MKKILAFLILFPLAESGAACTAPIGGDEIDSLIAVETVGESKFKITAPKKVGHLEYGATFTLAYYKRKVGNHRVAEDTREVEVQDKGDYYEVILEARSTPDMTPYVTVFWHPEQCCLCGAYGISDDLV